MYQNKFTSYIRRHTNRDWCIKNIAKKTIYALKANHVFKAIIDKKHGMRGKQQCEHGRIGHGSME
jgi:hypothetical protein